MIKIIINTHMPRHKYIGIISRNGWHCGHVISEKNGGETNIGNLRPICGSCNNSMGSMNWTTWENSTKNNEMNTCIESTI